MACKDRKMAAGLSLTSPFRVLVNDRLGAGRRQVGLASPINEADIRAWEAHSSNRPIAVICDVTNESQLSRICIRNLSQKSGTKYRLLRPTFATKIPKAFQSVRFYCKNQEFCDNPGWWAEIRGYSVGRTSKQYEISVWVQNNEISSTPRFFLKRLVKIHSGGLEIQKELLDLACGIDRN
ncbi:hypothetical protein FIV06_07120 [Labrenzia sp. THAF191b]|nr:hypothetical protein FIV06_07120 [Labrenzia sp. THAF191b]QFT03500.1 hypothetical protein FIV05_07120 [Labrenzia sp. THAF191a]QFT15042.1 hypothetical protein FIV03_07125 [Labrenzia sp. THAF187b]QFT66505.1 hypothetical protein FIU93_06930 [Labrenzia sp. THAF35]